MSLLKQKRMNKRNLELKHITRPLCLEPSAFKSVTIGNTNTLSHHRLASKEI